mgnify:CR=1 FL=1
MKGNIKRIGLVLLTLLTLSLGTLVVNAETKDSDFVIENGVLKQYKGNDDTVYIPEGVTKIASDAFKNNEIYNDKRTYAFEDDNYILLTDKFCARKIVLSSTVKELESYAIPTRTKELVLNEGLEILDDSALRDSSIKVLKLPSTLKKIGDAFSPYVKKITGNCKVAVVTDSNSGITQAQAKEMGVYVLPMPFMIDGTEYLEDINLTQKEFYEHLSGDHDVSTSQPSPETILNLWEKLLEEYDAVVHIPMSSGLSSSCQTAKMLADDFDGKVQVADNHRISVTQRRSVQDALTS